MKGLPSIELLESTHTFPGTFTIKAFGDNSEAFIDAARAAAVGVSGSDARVNLSYRASSKGNHGCVTLDVWVEQAHQVHALYICLGEIDGLRMLL